MKKIAEGMPVAFLFDQNVVRNNAVFVDFFGRPAATTAALGTISLKSEAHILLAALRTVGTQQYVLSAQLIEVDDIYQSASMEQAGKIHLITQRVTRQFEQDVLSTPEAWLWFHRRWKTRPEDSGLAHMYDPQKD